MKLAGYGMNMPNNSSDSVRINRCSMPALENGLPEKQTLSLVRTGAFCLSSLKEKSMTLEELMAQEEDENEIDETEDDEDDEDSDNDEEDEDEDSPQEL